jgi:hypothetical protein
MALDIGLDVGGSMSPSRSEPSLTLDDDGYYWFLHPLWERLRPETGQYIDLYGYAGFAGSCSSATADLDTTSETGGASWRL